MFDCTFEILNQGLLIVRSESLGDVVATRSPGSLPRNKLLVAELVQCFPRLKSNFNQISLEKIYYYKGTLNSKFLVDQSNLSVDISDAGLVVLDKIGSIVNQAEMNLIKRNFKMTSISYKNCSKFISFGWLQRTVLFLIC